MAVQRYTIDKYGIVETNHVSFPKTGRVFAQLPLKAEEFNAAAPCENGMWLVYDTINGNVHKPAAKTDVVGLVYSAEKEYNPYEAGLKNFALVPGGLYPRIGLPMAMDTYTTNCFCYDTDEFTDDAAVKTALAPETLKTTPVYLIPDTTDGAPKMTKTKDDTEGVIAQVVKMTTMPDGTFGIKVQFIKGV